MPRHLLPVLLIAPALLAPALAQQPAPASPPPPAAAEQPAYQAAPYQRILEEPDTGKLSLQMAVREFRPRRAGEPTVYLAGAVHIGRDDFYKSLQQFLDAQDVVLFEGVKPPGAGDPAMDEGAPQDDAAKAKATERRIRFIAMAVERFRAKNGRLPTDFDDLIQNSGERIGSLLKGATADAWGRPLTYTVLPAEDPKPTETVDGQPVPAEAAKRKRSPGYDIISPGADGAPDAGRASDDLRFSDQKPLSKAEAGDRSEGIQQQLANALGLVFQLTAMNHDRPNWRNSDLAVDQVQARLDRAGANADQLFSMLDGSSLFSRFGSFLLAIMSQSDQQKALLRVMMIEMIGRADQLLGGGAGGMGGAANMGKMMGVLLEDRNAVVIADLRKLLASEHPPKTVAIIYGAGHLPTMEKRLVQELAYTPAGDTWRTAIDVDPGTAGVSRQEIAQMRTMISRMLERQLGAPEKKKPAPADPEPVSPPS
jgi:hypothetical protein